MAHRFATLSQVLYARDLLGKAGYPSTGRVGAAHAGLPGFHEWNTYQAGVLDWLAGLNRVTISRLIRRLQNETARMR